jgi:hypothetical protein
MVGTLISGRMDLNLATIVTDIMEPRKDLAELARSDSMVLKFGKTKTQAILARL